MLQQKDDRILLIDEAVEKALDFKNKAMYLKAVDQGLIALKLAEAIDDPSRIASAYNSLGNIYKKQNQDSLALSFLLKAYEIRISTKQRELDIAYSVSNLALMYEKLGLYEKSLQFHKDAYELKQSLGIHAIQSVNARGMGFCYWKLGDNQKAFDYLQEAIDLNIDDTSFEIDRRNTKTFNILGEVNLSIGAYDAAYSHFLKSLELTKKHGFDDYLYLNYDALSRYFESRGNFEEAFGFHKKGISIRDSLIKAENLKIFTELNLRHNSERTQIENNRLTIETKGQQYELERRQQLQQQLIVVIVLTVIIIVLGILLLLRNRMQTKALQEKNNIINVSLLEKEELVQEIHHRVKNNLQIISSLFALQLKHIDDENAIKVVRDGLNLVMSMSIVHEKLYMDKSQNGIVVQEYISELLTSLRKSFPRSNLSFNLNICELVLDIETMIYVGMLLNELVTNVFKYAFKAGEAGNVEVELKRIGDKELLLRVADNGIGMNPDFATDKNSKTIGYKLIRSFLAKLKASMEVDVSSGTEVKIKITKFVEL